MHVYFIGIGGTAIGPLALLAKQAGHQVSGSDKQDSEYISYLRTVGINNLNIGDGSDRSLAKLNAKNPIDLIVYSSAVPLENPDHAEIAYASTNGIKAVKRDELLNKIIKDHDLKLVAIAGTHGKTTTTAMVVWLFKQLGMPCSYSVGAKIPFGDMGHFDVDSEYFIYECDEFDRNFLAFQPYLSVITGIDHDHHEQYPTKAEYLQAFKQFLSQSTHKVLWQEDAVKLDMEAKDDTLILSESDPTLNQLSLPGKVNRLDAFETIAALGLLSEHTADQMTAAMNAFPGVSRRFEKISENIYSDYAHTTPKIRGCLQLAKEVSDNVVIVYEPLTNRRQHYIREDYSSLFKGVKKLYWVPSYLAREDPDQPVITPREFIDEIEEPSQKEAAELDEKLKSSLQRHAEDGDLVVCLSGGGGGSLDEWLRKNFR